MTEKKKRVSLLYLAPVLFFAGLWLMGETGIYNDSNQYIAMHIHREPLYPFFLWIFRTLLGEENYLETVRFLQNAIAAFSVIWLTACLRRYFSLKSIMTLLVCLVQLAPHVITPLFSASGLVLSNGIVSEALVLPLFYLFTAECLKMVFDKSKKAAAWSLVLALLLSLTRGQMMFAVLLWMVMALAALLEKKQWKKTGIVLLCVVLAFGLRSFLVKSYNLAFNGYFINNTFGEVGMLANVLYAADRSDGERIEDEMVREYFYLSYDLAQEQQANYQYAPEGFLNRAAHLEQYHDMLKFDLIEEPWRARHDSEGFLDYIPENVESDRMAGIIIKSLLPAVFWRWFYDYMALSVYGLIRSVAVVHPLLNWYALFVYIFVILLAVYTFWKDRNSKAVRVAAFALLTVAANVYATSLIIMCLSRYMIYGLPVFYIAALLLLYENKKSFCKKI
ncbi:MAG: hypothetical protein Q4C58_06800 [Eubacteriales bacterium]|nr:hypothetical protein [Eubacteriales bacterium]